MTAPAPGSKRAVPDAPCGIDGLASGVRAGRAGSGPPTSRRRALVAISRKTGETLDLIQVAKEYARFLRERGREDEARQVEALSRPGASAQPSPEASGGPP